MIQRTAPLETRWHPELGTVLLYSDGAQSAGSMWDTPGEGANTAHWETVAENRALWAQGKPGYITAALASDGWWWKLTGD